MTSHVRFAGGPSADIPGMNPVARLAALSYAMRACPVFTPSNHRNAFSRGDGTLVRCVKCKRPQHQHWLRQALTSR